MSTSKHLTSSLCLDFAEKAVNFPPAAPSFGSMQGVASAHPSPQERTSKKTVFAPKTLLRTQSLLGSLPRGPSGMKEAEPRTKEEALYS